MARLDLDLDVDLEVDNVCIGLLIGDDVTVYGVMYQRWKPFSDGSPCHVELVLRANNVEVFNQHGAATSAIKDVQKEFEEFWDDYKYDPIGGKFQEHLQPSPRTSTAPCHGQTHV